MDDHPSTSTKFPCPVCDADTDSKADPLAKTSSDGKETLVNLVEKSGDSELKKKIEDAWEKKQLHVHRSCQKSVYNKSRRKTPVTSSVGMYCSSLSK